MHRLLPTGERLPAQHFVLCTERGAYGKLACQDYDDSVRLEPSWAGKSSPNDEGGGFLFDGRRFGCRRTSVTSGASVRGTRTCSMRRACATRFGPAHCRLPISVAMRARAHSTLR